MIRSLHHLLFRRVAYPLNQWRKGLNGRLWREYAAVDAMSREEVMDLQERRLREFLAYTGGQSPYYERVFRDVGFDVQARDIRAEVLKIPPIDKATLRVHGDEIVSREFAGRRDLITKWTGGSTGAPLQVLTDRDEDLRHELRGRRQRRWIGVDGPVSKTILYGGLRNHLSLPQRAAKCLFLEQRTENVYDYRCADYAVQVARLRRRPPQLLQAYFSIIRSLARQAELEGTPIRGIGAAVAVAETMGEEERRHAETWLGTRVYGQYANREMGMVAEECREQSGYHYHQDDIYIETLDSEGNPAVAGDLTLTYMASRVMPIVRYRIGDGAEIDESRCHCDLPYIRLRNIQGRECLTMSLPDGRSVPATVLNYFVRELHGVWEYQAEQVARDSLIIRIARREGEWTDAALGHVEEVMRNHLGASMRIEWRFDEPFIAVPSGKHVPFISRV